MLTASSSHFEFLAHIDSSSSNSNPNFRLHLSIPKLMDFHSLNRRDLQALCKLNKIPANMTNIAMADALKSIETKVEGIEEILNPSRSESAGSSIESPEKIEVTSPRVPRTSCRTSTRQKVKKTEAESVPATASRTTGRVVRRKLAGEVNELKTPMVSSTRKKVPTTSCRNVGSQLNECEEVAKNDCLVEHDTKCIPKTPAAVSTYSRRKGTTTLNQDTVKKETTVQRVYSTRRSTRLTAKKSAEPCVMEREISEPVKIDSFLDEGSAASVEDLGHTVQDISVGSDSASLETPHESNTSSENTDDKVGEGSVENYDVGDSKEKVEDICNAFEKLDVLVGDGSDQSLEIKKAPHVDASLESGEEKVDCSGGLDNNIQVQSVEILEQGADMDSEETQDDGGKLDNNIEMQSVEILEQGANMDSEETRQNDGGKLVLNEADNSEEKDGQVGNLKPDAVLVPEEHSDHIDADAIYDKPSLLSGIDNEVPECNVDVAGVDFVIPNEQELDMDFEAPAEEEEPQESLIAIDVMPTICEEPDLNSEQLNQEAEQTMDDADETTLESVADDSFIKEENQFPSKATDAVIDHPTSISEMTSDNNENSGFVVPVVVVEENKNINEKLEDEKAKSSMEMSLRQLKKQLKAMSIKSNTNTDKDDKVGEARPALQAVCDNQLVTEETDN